MIIAITGHRPNKLGNDYDLVSPLISDIKYQIVAYLQHKKPSQLISGMALGIDTLFAKIAIELNLPLIAAIPFKGQELKWPLKNQQVYNDILNYRNCSRYIVCSGSPRPANFQIRNEWMVKSCDILIAVWNGSTGGTKNCIDYAIKVNKEIHYIRI